MVGEGDDRRRHPGQRRASARATAVRLRNASTVMPDDTWANPLVGSDAGQPITKLAALNGVCWPTRISPALTSPSTTRVDVGVGDGDLEVLGGVAVGDGDGLVEVGRRARSRRSAPSEARAAVGPHGRAGRRAARSSSASAASASVGRRRDEHDRRVGAVLGLDQQVGGEADAGRRCRRRSRRSRSARAASSWRRRGAASRPGRSVTAGEPGPTTLRTVGIDSVPNPSAAMPAGPLTRNTSVMPSLRHTTSTAGSTAPSPPGIGGTTSDDLPARRRRPPARRAGRRRSGSWPCPTARTGRPTRSA